MSLGSSSIGLELFDKLKSLASTLDSEIPRLENELRRRTLSIERSISKGGGLVDAYPAPICDEISEALDNVLDATRLLADRCGENSNRLKSSMLDHVEKLNEIRNDTKDAIRHSVNYGYRPTADELQFVDAPPVDVQMLMEQLEEEDEGGDRRSPSSPDLLAIGLSRGTLATMGVRLRGPPQPPPPPREAESSPSSSSSPSSPSPVSILKASSMMEASRVEITPGLVVKRPSGSNKSRELEVVRPHKLDFHHDDDDHDHDEEEEEEEEESGCWAEDSKEIPEFDTVNVRNMLDRCKKKKKKKKDDALPSAQCLSDDDDKGGNDDQRFSSPELPILKTIDISKLLQHSEASSSLVKEEDEQVCSSATSSKSMDQKENDSAANVSLPETQIVAPDASFSSPSGQLSDILKKYNIRN